LYARFLPGLDDERHSIGYYRVETWRKIAGIVQPGEGRREIVMPNLKSKTQANLHMLRQALLALGDKRPERLIIHHNTRNLESSLNPELRDLLDPYPQLAWQHEKHPDLLQPITALLNNRRVEAQRQLLFFYAYNGGKVFD
jgi:hypothetical protein